MAGIINTAALTRLEIRICPTCWQLIRQDLCFCESCFAFVQNELLAAPTGPILQNENTVKPLFLWRAKGPGIVRRLIYALKGGHFPHVFEWLAGVHVSKYSRRKTKTVLFVPPANSKWQSKDHAEVWAKSLSNCTSQSFCFSPFIGEFKNSKQKEKSLRERQKRRVSLMKPCDPIATKIRSDLDFVFCDDVYSSGSTARACFRAMGLAAPREVWCIAYRPRHDYRKRELNLRE